MDRDDIKFLALQELGYEERPDFLTADDNAVRMINNQYEHIYSLALQGFEWSFSEKFTEVTTRGEDFDGRWKYNYALPEDVLYISGRYTSPKGGVISDYDWIGSSFYTNSETLFIKYTSKVCEEQLPAYFVDYLKYKLAKTICFNATGDTNLLQKLTNDEYSAYSIAKNTDIKQRPVRILSTAPFVNVRY